jgi:hypothetical protein
VAAPKAPSIQTTVSVSRPLSSGDARIVSADAPDHIVFLLTPFFRPSPPPPSPTSTSTYGSDYHAHATVCPTHGPMIPHQVFERLPFDAQSTYAHDYKAFAVAPPAHAAPLPPRPAPLPFEGQSEAAAQYREFAVQAPQGPGAVPARPAPLPFDATSTYRSDFVPKEASPHTAAPAVAHRDSGLRFEGESEAAARYREHKADPADLRWSSPVAPPRNEARLRFDAETTAAHDYREWEVKAPMAPAPVLSPKLALPFEGTSEARDKYKAWEPSAPSAPVPHPAYMPRADDRDFLSEAHKQYTEKRQEACPVSSLPAAPTPQARPQAWVGEHVLYHPEQRHYE